VLRGMGREIIGAGDTMVLETAGGGGRGDPQERDPDAIESDRKNGLID
jgi:N-methylhydantoinase B